MRYILLIYQNQQAEAGLSEEEQAALLQGWFDYTDDLQKAGKLLAGQALQPTAMATTVRVSGGKPLIADGPFAETKEFLGGYYLIEASDLDEALAWAGRAPHLPIGGAIEVRPLMEFSQGAQVE